MLLAFDGDPAIKDKYLARVRAHEAADEIVQGTAWENGKGCLIGCSLHSYNHKQYEIELGVPESIAQLLDSIFEGLPNAEAKRFPARALEAITPGADLSRIEAQFMTWLLTCDEIGLPWNADEKSRPVIARVAELWGRVAEGGEVSAEEWDAARDVFATVFRAAEAAAWNAARNAPRSAASAAASAGGRGTWKHMAAKLLSLLSDAPVPAPVPA